MTTGQPNRGLLTFGFDNTQFGVRVKCPKVVLGPLELGVAATYTVAEADDDDLAPFRLDRFKPTLNVKDVFLRGKFELEPRKLHYSKKFRLPFLNTDMVKLRLTAQLPQPQAATGLLGRALGLTVSLSSDPLYAKSTVRKAPQYAIQLAPRVGLPQGLYDDIGFPGSVYFKTNAMLQVSDASSVRGLRAHLDIRSINAVVRLYDPRNVKPGRLGRNVAHAVRRLTMEDAEAEEEARHVHRAVKVARVLEASPQQQPDVIDVGAAKLREWAHAILVNSCVATRHLQDHIKALAQGKAQGVTTA